MYDSFLFFATKDKEKIAPRKGNPSQFLKKLHGKLKLAYKIDAQRPDAEDEDNNALLTLS